MRLRVVLVIRAVITQQEKINGFCSCLFMSLDQKVITIKWILFFSENDPHTLAALGKVIISDQTGHRSHKPFVLVFVNVVDVDGRNIIVRPLCKFKVRELIEEYLFEFRQPKV